MPRSIAATTNQTKLVWFVLFGLGVGLKWPADVFSHSKIKVWSFVLWSKLHKALVSEPGKTGFSWKTGFVDPILQLRGFWPDRSVWENGAQLYGPRVFNFLSHRIVKSLTCRIYGKLKFQFTRNVYQNPPFCQGLSRTPLSFSSISHHHSSPTIFSKTSNLENRKSGNSKTQVH